MKTCRISGPFPELVWSGCDPGNGPLIVVGNHRRKNHFHKEPRSAKYSPRVMKGRESDLGLWAVEPPQTRFARILATGVAPALDGNEICTCSSCQTPSILEAAGQEESRMAALP
jgi:hypothetical protein